MIQKIFITPFQRFIKTESTAGILLFAATILALIWANSDYSSTYEGIWQYELGFSFNNFELRKPLILWINDGLMSIFFFLIGLELKRELLVGELNTLKKAAFPFVAALGGVLIPVILYLTFNKNPETTQGWGIPMATDVAFALAILTTLGKRVPLSLKIFLTAFAIVDDIAAVLVIAIFYSAEINWLYLVYGTALIVLLGVLYNKRKYSLEIGLILAVVIWFLFLKSGLHPTIAGVLLAFTIPIKKNIDAKSFSENLASISGKILDATDEDEKHLLTKQEEECIDELDELSAEMRSPLQHLEHKLHNWIAYFILPVFAFANAGITFSSSEPLDVSLMLNIALSLVIGKTIGVALFSYLGLKLKITSLPAGVKFKQIIGIAAIAGVGFTMSIFIGNLAFAASPVYITAAKTGIVFGSLVAGIVGYIILRLTHNKTQEDSES